VELCRLVEEEARAASCAAPALTDEAVAEALRRVAGLVREQRAAILGANEADVEAATGRLDEGTLDRLRLDE
jgi:gamma-glutamyl phosphate reductase